MISIIALMILAAITYCAVQVTYSLVKKDQARYSNYALFLCCYLYYLAWLGGFSIGWLICSIGISLALIAGYQCRQTDNKITHLLAIMTGVALLTSLKSFFPQAYYVYGYVLWAVLVISLLLLINAIKNIDKPQRDKQLIILVSTLFALLMTKEQPSILVITLALLFNVLGIILLYKKAFVFIFSGTLTILWSIATW